MPPRPRYSVHPSLARMRGSAADAAAYLRDAPRYVEAMIKPATKTRIDFGLALGGLKGKGRLQETGGFAKKDRITHRIAVASIDDIDQELRDWLRRAYEGDAG